VLTAAARTIAGKLTSRWQNLDCVQLFSEGNAPDERLRQKDGDVTASIPPFKISVGSFVG